MQHYILSEITDTACLDAEGKNGLRRCIELLGIYDDYIDAGGDENDNSEFEKYYLEKADLRRWHYVNIGTRKIHKRLEDSYRGIGNHRYRIFKNTIRRYGITKANHRVVVYEGTYVVLREALKLIREHDAMRLVYKKHIHKILIEDFLTFQETCIVRYLSTGEGIKQKYYGNEINGRIIDLLKEG